MIKELTDRHEEWLKIAYSICKDLDLSKDLVQDMYIRINRYVQDPGKIINDGKVNSLYIYVTIKNIFHLYEKSQRDTFTNLDGSMSFLRDTIEDDPEVTAKNEAMEKAHDSVINAIFEEVSDWHWYDEKLFRLYFCTDKSLRDIANGQINGKQVIKKRVGRENIRRRIKMLCEKDYLEERFYRNVAYWVPKDAK